MTENSSLLTHAVKVVDHIGFGRSEYYGWCEWLTDHELLIARGSKATQYTFYRKNVVTGKERPLRHLTETYFQWNHNHTTFSPDGRFALWRGSDYKIKIVALDGSDYTRTWEDPSDEHNDLVWMPDSRHWLLLQQWNHKAKECLSVYRFDREAPKRRKTQRIAAPIGDIECITPNGTILTGEYLDEIEKTKEVTIVETRLSAHPEPARRYRIPIPAGKKLCSFNFSSTDDRIVWTFEEPQKRCFSVWVSSRKGTNWRSVGTIPRNPNDRNDPPEVSWVPGGKSLTFDWNGACWRVPLL